MESTNFGDTKWNNWKNKQKRFVRSNKNQQQPEAEYRDKQATRYTSWTKEAVSWGHVLLSPALWNFRHNSLIHKKDDSLTVHEKIISVTMMICNHGTEVSKRCLELDYRSHISYLANSPQVRENSILVLKHSSFGW